MVVNCLRSRRVDRAAVNLSRALIVETFTFRIDRAAGHIEGCATSYDNSRRISLNFSFVCRYCAALKVEFASIDSNGIVFTCNGAARAAVRQSQVAARRNSKDRATIICKIFAVQIKRYSFINRNCTVERYVGVELNGTAVAYRLQSFINRRVIFLTTADRS